MQSVHLLQLLLPHAAQGLGRDVQVRQLLQEDRQQLVLLHRHWRQKPQLQSSESSELRRG